MDLGTRSTFRRLQTQLAGIQAALRESGVDAWLLYDLHARNSVSARMLELGDLTRRYFVLVPQTGTPIAVTHAIEQLPWTAWPWEKKIYSGWKHLDELLQSLLANTTRVAMEISDRDAVPAMDLVPWGVVELIRSTNTDVITSADLVTQFYARWSVDDYKSHIRASVALTQIAQAAFRRLANEILLGGSPTEGDLREWVLADMLAHGLTAGRDCIPATGVNAANPHYGPEGAGATFKHGDVVLLDLWAKEDEDSVFSDQTWMGYLGATVPQRADEIFNVARDARDAAVRFLNESWESGRIVQGMEVDDVARAVIRERGYEKYFIHRTGHSIDQATHGMGPNIDNFETRETRKLIPGVAFSIEPGIYIDGEIGVRTEINVYMTENGPEVTTPGYQDAMFALLPE